MTGGGFRCLSLPHAAFPRRAAAVIALAAALAPAPSLAQAIALGAGPEPGGTVVGRVCLDRDGDGRCAAGEPGVAGARLLAEGGQVALADGSGRFHLLEVPGRALLTDRVAYGGHVVAAEGLGVRRSFELGPLGAAQVDLAVPAPPPSPPLSLASAAATPGPGRGPARAPDGRLSFELGGRTVPGARVAIGAERAVAGPDGTFAVEVLLAPGENRLAVAAVAPSGAAAVWSWTVQLVPRRAGGDLVAPEEPVRLASLDVVARGGGALVTGRLDPAHRARVAGVVAASGDDGAFAAYAPAGDPSVALLDGAGHALASAALPLAEGGGLRGTAALAEVEVSFLGDPGVLVTGRGAGSARARLGPVDLEAGLDLDDRDRHGPLADLVRPRESLVLEHALDPERSLASPGDDAAAGDRNAGRGRLWARIEAPGARLDVGAARTGLGERELGRFDRALYGASARAEGALGPVALHASGFGATLREDAGGNAPPAAAHDVLDATGGAALWLAHGSVVPGSEALRLEWRDPVTGRLAGERRLVRGEDYELDWTSGRVVLAVPLASVGRASSLVTAAPFAAARASLVADYLTATAGPGADDLQGGRVGAVLAGWSVAPRAGTEAAAGAGAVATLSLSAHAANEDRAGDGYRLAGAGAVLDLGRHLLVRADVARSRGTPFGASGGLSRSADGGYAFGSTAAPERGADALHVEARGAAGPVAIEGWWRERDAGYADGEFHEPIAARAARERGAEARLDRGPASLALLWAERRGAGEDDPAGLRPIDARHFVARAGLAGERGSLVLEGVRAEQGGVAEGTATSAGARATWKLDDALSLDLSHHQGLATSGAARDPTFTAAGAALSHGRSTLAVRGGWGPDLGPQVLVSGERGGPDEAVYGTFSADPDAPDVLGGRGATSALGARRASGAAEVFTEEQVARDAFGLRTARVFGLALAPAAGLRVSLSGERGERLRLDGSRVERSAVAGTAGAVRGRLRVAARGELRREGADEHVAAGGSLEWTVAAGIVLSLRTSYLDGTIDGREALGLETSIAGALRRDRGALLASLARIADERPGAARRDAVVARLAGTTRLARLEVGLGAALAIQEVGGGRDDRIVGSARARLPIAGRLDGAVEYARRAPLTGGDLGAVDALRLEAGASARESRLAVGYTLVGFAGDGLAPAADTGRLYVRAQLAY